MEYKLVVKYFISAVWFKDSKTREHITHVLLHNVDQHGNVGAGRKVSKEDVLPYVDKNIVFTAVWDYEMARWSSKAMVKTDTVDGVIYLRSIADNSVKDNLKHLLSGNIIHNIPRVK